MARILAGSIGIAALLLLAGCRCGPSPPAACTTSRDCADDGLFCTAAPTCVFDSAGRGTCSHAAARCDAHEVCDESGDRCHLCPDPERPECDAIMDAGPPDAPRCEALTPGTPCTPGTCASSECQAAFYSEWGASVRRDGTAGRPLPIPLFPDGYCGRRCNATRLNDECEPCATCVHSSLAGHTRLPLYYTMSGYLPEDGVCRQRCTPSATGTGCAREGYTCDPETLTCMEACIDDRQCQIVQEDVDGDGNPDLLDRGATFPSFCDALTGRCRTRGTAGASIGDPCTEDTDCADDGWCFRRDGEVRGICSQRGCRSSAIPCPPGSRCDIRNAGPNTSACFPACEVGAEEGSAAVRGSSTGGHPDCGRGLSCVWNGIAESGASETGSCLPGHYNDRTAPNVGAPCATDADCDSPYGYGQCLFSELSGTIHGICTVRHCSTFLEEGETVDGIFPKVRLATPICDRTRGELCVALGDRREPPQTYCLTQCESAAECPRGYACSELLAGGARFCWPYCFDSSECGAGARCESATGEECLDSRFGCFCSDRRPSP